MTSRILTAALLASSALPVLADEDRWSVAIESITLDVSGNDRHVLTDRAVGGAGATTESTHQLDAGSSFGYRTEVHRAGERWTFGFDFLLYTTDQKVDRQTGAGGGAIDQRIFVVGGGQVASDDPSEQLYFERLSDTTIELWAADFLASRAVAAGARSELRLAFGVRAADFDNDYRAVVGVEDVGGLRLDSSSNYDRMHGPLVALTGTIDLGRNRLEGYLGQSVVFGDVQLSSRLREFAGPPILDTDTDFPAIRDESFNAVESVTIPMTELRLEWRYRISDHFALGAGAFLASWWDLAVPPGVVAGSTIDTRDENTISLYGLSGGLTVSF
ncbi:MAG: hypothetical protein L0221_11425 [Chloroflexi bacterium]|nr:hypothetical protein [Chloroflexota bacterium]